MPSVLLTFIKPDHRKEALAHFNRAANFFKHADTDHDEAFDGPFSDEVNDHSILLPCLDYLALREPVTWPIQCFMHWIYMGHPDWLTDDALLKPLYRDTQIAREFREWSRKERLESGLLTLENPPNSWRPYSLGR